MKRSRNPIIDLMRFVFIICVVLHHAILFRPRIMAGYIGEILLRVTNRPLVIERERLNFNNEEKQ